MPCVHHCHSTSVDTLPAPPLTIYTLDSQTLCPEERVEGERVGGERRAGAEEEGRGDREGRGKEEVE